ncbi:MAG: cytochrome c [Nitrospirae bacterium]|nr:cytochrome c [Nitrospirota bacterium]MCZ6780217.1 cytochrome c [Nitrospirota bacterium]
MPQEQSFTRNVIKKGVVGLVLGVIFVVVAKALAFPPVFQAMFFFYAMLGTAVFILLDAPPLKPVTGVKALITLVVFYAVLSVVYVGGASLWPQYDPEVEKGKIIKLLKAKRAKTELGKTEELLARTQVLSEKADAIMARLRNVGGTAIAMVPAGAGEANATRRRLAASGDLVALGEEQWELQECYNCHTIFGKKSKKRGPKLDNIGNLMTAEQLREKIVDPLSWMAEGFEKQFKKKKMPDKYRDLMEDSEIDALVVFLTTLKNPAVETPKPIKKK